MYVYRPSTSYGAGKAGIYSYRYGISAVSYTHLDVYKRQHLNISDALSYLQKKSFKLNTDKGIYLVKYLNLALGWIKIIDDDRFNNYFPVDWRIINM